METKSEHERGFHIEIDSDHFTVEQTGLTGAQLKALAHKDPSYQLFEELPGDADRQVADGETVAMKSGLRFYTVPPASFGCHEQRTRDST